MDLHGIVCIVQESKLPIYSVFLHVEGDLVLWKQVVENEDQGNLVYAWTDQPALDCISSH